MILYSNYYTHQRPIAFLFFIMAVQAQYPSNLLFFNRNGQEGHEYSSQPPPPPPQAAGGGGGFLDQSASMLFTNGGGGGSVNNHHHRKRGRESVMTTTTPHHHRPIDISHLQYQPNLVVSTGLRLSFPDQNHHQQQSINVCSSPAFLSLFSDHLAAQIKQQRDELDQFLQAQGEELRRALGEKRQRHYRALVTAAEETVAGRLREKEVEAEKAARRNAELEARAAQLTVEAQVWQAKARAQEATAANLQAQLQHAIMSGAGAQDSMMMMMRPDHERLNNGADGGQAEDAESAYVDPERTVVMAGPPCKSCRDRAASVVLLPCRHLCLCTECDQVAQACPLCLTLRNSSVEVFLT